MRVIRKGKVMDMNKREIVDGIYSFSMNIDNIIFENMWELPHGVSMNSYIVKGNDVAIIDGVIGWDGVPETLYKNLKDFDIELEDIKYLVVNHVEMDHTGWLTNFKKMSKDFTVVATKKGEDIIKSFYGDDMNILVVKDGDTLDLGHGKILAFYEIPNVHWPETMMTYEISSKALFPCDLYGIFGTVKGHLYDDELTDDEKKIYAEEGLRYYTNVMMTYTPRVKKAIEKTRALDIKLILPGHGILYRGNPDQIVDDYERWGAYTNGQGENEVTIIWGSMYGSTEKMVNYTKGLLEKEGIKVKMVQMPYDTQSNVLTKSLSSAAIIIAAPTYEYKMFPPVAHALDELGRKRMIGKKTLYFGSAGWIGGAKKDFESILETSRMKWDIVDALEFIGTADEDAYQMINHAVKKLIESMKENIYQR